MPPQEHTNPLDKENIAADDINPSAGGQVEDIERAHYMALESKDAERKGAAARQWAKDLDRADEARLEQKIRMLGAGSLPSVLRLIDMASEPYAVKNTAELLSPKIERLNNKWRASQKRRAAAKIEKYEAMANEAADRAAHQYDATNGQPYLIDDVETARKQAKARKEMIEWKETELARMNADIAGLDADSPRKKWLEARAVELSDSIWRLKNGL